MTDTRLLLVKVDTNNENYIQPNLELYDIMAPWVEGYVDTFCEVCLKNLNIESTRPSFFEDNTAHCIYWGPYEKGYDSAAKLAYLLMNRSKVFEGVGPMFTNDHEGVLSLKRLCDLTAAKHNIKTWRK